MATFNQRNITEFRSRLTGGGARANLFEIEIAFPEELGIDLNLVTDKVPFLVKAAEIPASNLGNIPVPYRGRVLPVAGDRTFDPWTVTVINDTDFLIRNAIERWSNGINNHSDNEGLVNPVDYQVDAFVDHLDRNGNTIKSYTFRGMYPTIIGQVDLTMEQATTLETFECTWRYQYWESNTTT